MVNSLFAIFCGIVVMGAAVFCYRTTTKYRQQLSDSAEQIAQLEQSVANAKLANSELERQLEEQRNELSEQQKIADELNASSQQSISNVNEIIELIKDIRKKIALLEDMLHS